MINRHQRYAQRYAASMLALLLAAAVARAADAPATLPDDPRSAAVEIARQSNARNGGLTGPAVKRLADFKPYDPVWFDLLNDPDAAVSRGALLVLNRRPRGPTGAARAATAAPPPPEVEPLVVAALPGLTRLAQVHSPHERTAVEWMFRGGPAGLSRALELLADDDNPDAQRDVAATLPITKLSDAQRAAVQALAGRVVTAGAKVSRASTPDDPIVGLFARCVTLTPEVCDVLDRASHRPELGGRVAYILLDGERFPPRTLPLYRIAAHANPPLVAFIAGTLARVAARNPSKSTDLEVAFHSADPELRLGTLLLVWQVKEPAWLSALGLPQRPDVSALLLDGDPPEIRKVMSRLACDEDDSRIDTLVETAVLGTDESKARARRELALMAEATVPDADQLEHAGGAALARVLSNQGIAHRLLYGEIFHRAVGGPEDAADTAYLQAALTHWRKTDRIGPESERQAIANLERLHANYGGLASIPTNVEDDAPYGLPTPSAAAPPATLAASLPGSLSGATAVITLLFALLLGATAAAALVAFFVLRPDAAGRDGFDGTAPSP